MAPVVNVRLPCSGFQDCLYGAFLLANYPTPNTTRHIAKPHMIQINWRLVIQTLFDDDWNHGIMKLRTLFCSIIKLSRKAVHYRYGAKFLREQTPGKGADAIILNEYFRYFIKT